MNLSKLTNDQLLKCTKNAVTTERDAVMEVLRHLREVERRMLYAEKSSSLFAYCVGELGYDGASAQLRISAMRLLKELPELTEKVEEGALNLSLLSQAQTYFHREKIKQPEQKRKIIQSIAGKTTREAQKELLGQTQNPEAHRPEKIRVVSATHLEVRFLIDEEFMKELDTLKALLAHAHPGATIKDLVKVAVRESIQNRIPKKPIRAHAAKIKAEMKRVVWHRDQGKCGICGSNYALEYDHIQPVAFGGQTTVENLRLRCRKHNQWEAVKLMGAEKMSEHIPSLRNEVA